MTAAALVFLIASSARAEDSGFLTDYSKLAPGGDYGFTRAYSAPGAADAIARFGQVMIDQPSFVISPDSKYRGVKPSDINSVGEALRTAVIEGVESRFKVVDKAGDGAIVMSWAVSNIRLNKAKRGLLTYTPVGAVAYGAKTLASDVIDKTRAFDLVFEVELTDALTDEVLFALVYAPTEVGEEAKWGDVQLLATGLGQRLGCRLMNARLPKQDRENCLAIPVSPPPSDG
jgi:hypothetical protein